MKHFNRAPCWKHIETGKEEICQLKPAWQRRQNCTCILKSHPDSHVGMKARQGPNTSFTVSLSGIVFCKIMLRLFQWTNDVNSWSWNDWIKRQPELADNSMTAESISEDSRKLNYFKLHIQLEFCRSDSSQFIVALSLHEQAFGATGETNQFVDYLNELPGTIIVPRSDDKWIYDICWRSIKLMVSPCLMRQ